VAGGGVPSGAGFGKSTGLWPSPSRGVLCAALCYCSPAGSVPSILGGRGKGSPPLRQYCPRGVEGLSFSAIVGSCSPSPSWLVSRYFFNDCDSGLRSLEVVIHVRFGVLASAW
jgi:hypothetical protein